MVYTERISEGLELIDTINPASYAAEQNTGNLKISNYVRVIVVIHCGVIGADLDVDLEQAATATGTVKTLDAGSKDVVIANASDNTVTVIEIRPDELDVNGGYEYINVELTPGGASIFAVQVWGIPVYKPAAITNLLSVVD